MIKLADFCYRHRRWVLAAWVVALVAVFVIGGAVKAEHRANYETPGAESTHAYDLLADRFPARKGDSVKLVFAGDIDDPAVQSEIERVIDKAEQRPRVVSVESPYDNEAQISQNRRIAYAEVNFDARADQLVNDDAEFAKHFLDVIRPGQHGPVEVQVTQLQADNEIGSEVIGLIFAAAILIIAFGSLVAAGLPIVTALFGLGIGATLGGVASRIVETPDWAATVAVMIGLGVGIDYALFIVTRYRASLASGLGPRESVITAMGTAGKAVFFAGMTVMISLLGMLTMGLSYLRGVTTSSVLAVLCVLAAALTLLPALLGFAGNNINRLRVPFSGRPSHQGNRAFWYRWSRVIQHRPWTSFLGAVVVLVVITLPVFGLRLGFPDDGNNPESYTSRQAYDLLTSGFGPGFNGPLVLVADLRGADDPAGTLDEIASEVQNTKDVVFVTPPSQNSDGDTAILTVFPRHKPQDEATSDLVGRLRDRVLPAVTSDTGAKVLVGGATAISIDQSDYIKGRLPLFIGAVVFLSFLLLTMVFRSPLVALKAGVMNLLSITAAYGVMAYAVQGGWLGDLLNIPETPIPAFVPMIMFAILFGLSMDYEVFLLSRIREEYLRTHDNRASVADGLASSARVITAAAAIMAFVFGVFVLDPSVFIKQIGLGLATAVIVDATIVRMILVPATMELLGDANWWMPRWLDRVMPEVHIDGEEAVEAELAALLESEQVPA